MNRRDAEEKARRIATNTFSDGTMRTMLYERILDAFCPTPEKPPREDAPVGDNTKAVGAIFGLR